MAYTDIITLDEFKMLARPTSVHLDEAHFVAYLQEAEAAHIIPAIGYELYDTLTHAGSWDDDSEEWYTTLLEGGEFTFTPCGCGDSVTKYCHGLKKATAYFTYAAMQKADGGVMARGGFMRHRDEYGEHVDDNRDQYNSAMDMAELYLDSVMEALKSNDNTTRRARQSRARIKAIGD